jgi:hypothetical protein
MNGEWKVEGGRWKVEGGRWKVEGTKFTKEKEAGYWKGEEKPAGRQ